MQLTGTHKHATLGVFHYTADYTTKQPNATWFVDWNATAVNDAGQALDLRGGCVEILVGAPGAAPALVERLIHQEIDALI